MEMTMIAAAAAAAAIVATASKKHRQKWNAEKDEAHTSGTKSWKIFSSFSECQLNFMGSTLSVHIAYNTHKIAMHFTSQKL